MNLPFYVCPSGQNFADSLGNPRGLWLLVGGIHADIWVVSETRIQKEIQRIFFKSGLKWEGSFPQNCKHFNSPKNDNKPSLWYFLITSYVIKFHLKIFEGSTREISMRKYPQGFLRERRQKYPHRKFRWISAGKSWGNFCKDDSLEFPINLCGNEGGVDGSPAGVLALGW